VASAPCPRLLSLEDPNDRLAVQTQLERLLDSPSFRNSKRYPKMLRYVVEQTLAGHSERLKERCLGVEVFGRAPDYDTNADPVVRMSAAEIRKRIAQYYDDAEHRDELRLELPVGSYIPGFHVPDRPQRESDDYDTVTTAVALTIAHPEIPEAPTIIAVPAKSLFARMKLAVGGRRALAALAVILIAVSAVSFIPRRTALDTFWAPLVNDPNSVLICAGRSGNRAAIAWPDVVTLTRVVALFADHKHPYQLRREDTASFNDLRNGPTVLIGAFNDAWTMRLTKGSRYDFLHDDTGRWIIDRQNGSRKWGIPPSNPDPSGNNQIHEDFAIVSRVLDPTTGNMLVTAGGLAGFGTTAAGEFLTNEKAMHQVLSSVKAEDWRSRNIQVVLRTVVIGGSSGPPQVIATYVW
jgi:hypothetical protein